MCPHCGRDAPIVYRGFVPYCTACGRLRPSLSAPSINWTGKPQQVGGTVAAAFGALVLLFGLSAALGVGMLLYALTTVAVALAVSLPIAFVALALGIVLVRTGHGLRRSAAMAQHATREQALVALAEQRGPITAADASRALGISMAEADGMLTDLAKREPDRVAVEVDDRGMLWYRIAPIGEPLRVRVDGNEDAGDGIREVAGYVAHEEEQRASTEVESDVGFEDEEKRMRTRK
jgi:hypothetical protein